MRQVEVDLAIIGGGPAGLAAALAASEEGALRVLIIERHGELGGILQQCIHPGFGLHRFQEELTGPEYAGRFLKMFRDTKIEAMLETTVLEINEQRQIYAVNSQGGLEISAQAIILAMGCRERPRGALNIPGSRPAGIFSAGTAQYFLNVAGYAPGKKVVILGSGDIGLIMARRLTLEGAQVEAVVEVLPYAAGLRRNVAQCLEDFEIPLYLASTVTKIHGDQRVEAVTVARVDQNWQPIPGTEKKLVCDTLLLSVGLIPENELSLQAGVTIDPLTGGPRVDEALMTNVDGIFACGNALHVHDLVDNVSREAERAGRLAARYILQREKSRAQLPVVAGEGIRYVLPQQISLQNPVEFFLRVKKPQENVTLDLGGVRRLPKRAVNPGEMLNITLSQEVLAKFKGQAFTVRLLGGGK